jgi:CRISPR-associated protein (TIGR03986 family)
VRVGVAWSDKTLDDTTLVPLRVLGGPKSKYYPFYLRPSSPREDASTKCGYYSADSGDWWHRPGQLRGRKFYLHHPAGMAGNALSYVEFTPELAKAAKASGVHTHQNATCAVLPVGAEFSGYVEFDSLADYELGMLLWAMALSDSPRDVSTECAHKLGMGRPIGMGSVRLKVGEVVVEDPLDGWKETAAPERKLNVNEARELVRVFKTWMMTARDGEQADDVTPDDARVREFDEQTSYKELCAVLRTDLAGTTPVCYPEIKYFLNQRQARNVGAEEPLKLPLGIAGGGRQDMDANASPPRRGAGGRGAGGGRGPERGRPEPRDRWNKQKRW